MKLVSYKCTTCLFDAGITKVTTTVNVAFAEPPEDILVDLLGDLEAGEISVAEWTTMALSLLKAEAELSTSPLDVLDLFHGLISAADASPVLALSSFTLITGASFAYFVD
jgi:hypothetical protein